MFESKGKHSLNELVILGFGGGTGI